VNPVTHSSPPHPITQALIYVKMMVEHFYIGVNVMCVGSFACCTSLPNSDLDVTVVVAPDQLIEAGGEKVSWAGVEGKARRGGGLGSSTQHFLTDTCLNLSPSPHHGSPSLHTSCTV
jgi:hypothetical protein